MLWQLLGQLDADEVLIQLPEWLAEETIGFVAGVTPTAFVGRIEWETAKALHFADSVDARSLMKVVHRIHQLKQDAPDRERNGWLDDRLEDHRRAFKQRDHVVPLQNEWVLKSQIRQAVQRVSSDD